MADHSDRTHGSQPDLVLRLAAHATDAADALAETADRLTHADPGSHVFGGAAQGRLGELGRGFHKVLVDSLRRQGTTVQAHGARYADLAVDLRAVLASYDEADRAAQQQFRPDESDSGWRQ